MSPSFRSRFASVLVLTISIVLNYGCNNTQGGPGKTVTVDILPGSGIADENTANDFSPYELKIRVGTGVTWVNKDSMIHFVNTKDRFLNSPVMMTGDEYTVTFNNTGEYQYYCSAHRWMRGKIYVR